MLLPAKTQLASATVTKYRELLRKLNANAAGADEGSAAAFLQAKERVLARLGEGRERGRVDPLGALRRAHDRLATARQRVRGLRQEQGQRLRHYYRQALAAGSQEGQRALVPRAGRAHAAELDAAAAAAATESNGVLRVRCRRGRGRRVLVSAHSHSPLWPDLCAAAFVQAAVLAGVGGACKAFLAGASRTTVRGGEIMAAALDRPAGQPLITVSNHVSSLDDPMVTAALVPPAHLLRPGAVRWTLCATDRCFRHAALAPFFRAGKVLPVERGAGVAQFGMRVAADRLRAGDWVHIFPEGTRGGGGGARMLPARRGVGWLVAACDTPPLVVPFVHSGMEGVVPRGAALPRPGREVRVLVGPPVAVEDLLAAAAAEGWGERELHCAIADRVGAALCALRAELEGVAAEAVAPEPGAAAVALQEEALLPLIQEELERARGRGRWRARWEALGLRPYPPLAGAAAAAAAAAGWPAPLEAQLGETFEMLRGTVRAARTRLERAAGGEGGSSSSSSNGSRPSGLSSLADDGRLLQAMLQAAADYSAARARHVRELLRPYAGEPGGDTRLECGATT
jgi:monolysocardiolipin acyltransferase